MQAAAGCCALRQINSQCNSFAARLDFVRSNGRVFNIRMLLILLIAAQSTLAKDCPHTAADKSFTPTVDWRAHDQVCWSGRLEYCSDISKGANKTSQQSIDRSVSAMLPSCLLATDLFANGFEDAPQSSVKRWSDPSTWGGNLPQAGANVLIAANQTIVLDVNTPSLGTLTIEGRLVAAMDRGTAITARAVMVHGGTLRYGCATDPYMQQGTITLTGEASEENLHGMGTKVLGSMGGGTIAMYGAPRQSWTKLDGTVQPGATSIGVLEATGWKVGDQIAIAPSDFEPLELEKRFISAINGNVLTLAQPLSFYHFGRIQTLGTTGRSLDERAPIANLSRNIVIRGQNSAGSNFGGHLMMMEGSAVELSHVEITGMGQAGRLGRYPLHWHIAGNRLGSFVENSSIHSNFQRGVVVHRTNDLKVRNNAIVDTFGHMVFIESSNEVRNHFEGNLLMLTRPMPSAWRNINIEFEHQRDEVAGFWLSNMHNRVMNNHVAGILHGHGYWVVDGAFSTPRDRDFCIDGVINQPFGGCHLGPSSAYNAIRQSATVLEFRDNVASNIRAASEWNGSFHFDPVGSGIFFEDLPLQTNAPTILRNTQAYKIGMSAIWGTMKGELAQSITTRTPVIDGLIVADVRTATFNAEHHRSLALRNAVLFGTTDNQPPGLTSGTRNWEALFVSHGNGSDDRSIEAIAVYPFIPPSSNNLSPALIQALPLTNGGEPRFLEWTNVVLQGWRN
jgi:hypothetical protein